MVFGPHDAIPFQEQRTLDSPLEDWRNDNETYTYIQKPAEPEQDESVEAYDTEVDFLVQNSHFILEALQEAARQRIELWDQTDSTWEELDMYLYTSYRIQRLISNFLYGED